MSTDSWMVRKTNTRNMVCAITVRWSRRRPSITLWSSTMNLLCRRDCAALILTSCQVRECADRSIMPGVWMEEILPIMCACCHLPEDWQVRWILHLVSLILPIRSCQIPIPRLRSPSNLPSMSCSILLGRWPLT